MRKSKFCKKLICILSCVATCASVFAPISVSAATIYPEYSSAVYDTNITRPYWESDVIFNEVCCPIGRWDNGSEAGYGEGCAFLTYKPVKILSVKDQTLKKTYVEGTDYVVDANTHKLTFPQGSRIKYFDSRAGYTAGKTDDYAKQLNDLYGSRYSYSSSGAANFMI